jgi:uncharacterized protein with PQ loop repeat
VSSRSHHHYHYRKQKTRVNNGYIGKLVLAAAIIEPLMTIPQIYQIWGTKKAQGVSLLSWSFYLLAAVIWLLYGFKVRDKAVVWASILWVLVEGMVIVGILVY